MASQSIRQQQDDVKEKAEKFTVSIDNSREEMSKCYQVKD